MSRNQFSTSHKAARLAQAAAWLLAACCMPAWAGLEVNPVFPSYGDPVALELNGVGAAPWVPGTRYRREGNTITLEMENMPGGWFGQRTDMQYMPVPVGELAPGRYSLQARLYDMRDPGAAARIFTQSLEVAAPDAVGVYSVPRSPGALEPFELMIRSDLGLDPKSLRATVSGTSIRIDFAYSSDAAAPTFASVKIAGLIPAAYQVEAYGANGFAGAITRRVTGSVNVTNTSRVVEYYAPGLDHYFISAWPDEIAALDAGYDFKRTGQQFKAWLRQADAPAYAAPVCRFYATGPNSHFYTADPNECQMLKSLEEKQKAESRAKGQAFEGWQFEAVAFYALTPQNGACPVGTTPVHRFYNNRAAQNDSNHRFTATEAMRFVMSLPAVDEGVAFCSPA